MSGRILEQSSDHSLSSMTATGEKHLKMPTKGVPTDGLLDALASQYGKDSFRVETRHNVFHITIVATRNTDSLRQETTLHAACRKPHTTNA